MCSARLPCGLERQEGPGHRWRPPPRTVSVLSRQVGFASSLPWALTSLSCFEGPEPGLSRGGCSQPPAEGCGRVRSPGQALSTVRAQAFWADRVRVSPPWPPPPRARFLTQQVSGRLPCPAGRPWPSRGAWARLPGVSPAHHARSRPSLGATAFRGGPGRASLSPWLRPAPCTTACGHPGAEGRDWALTCRPAQARLFDEPQLASLCLENIDKNTADAIAAEGFTDIDRGEARGGGPASLRRGGRAPAPAAGLCARPRRPGFCLAHATLPSVL